MSISTVRSAAWGGELPRISADTFWRVTVHVACSRHVDHIVPARLIRKLRAGKPDRRENLQCIRGTDHGYELQTDHKLCLGDKLGYLQILREHHFEMDRVEQALRMYGM